jgi:hypothetical protein
MHGVEKSQAKVSIILNSLPWGLVRIFRGETAKKIIFRSINQNIDKRQIYVVVITAAFHDTNLQRKNTVRLRAINCFTIKSYILDNLPTSSIWGVLRAFDQVMPLQHVTFIY